MKKLLPQTLVIATLLSAPAMGGTFDGSWIGYIAASPGCPEAAMTITVSGETISGAVHNPRNVAPFTGSIDANGNATFTTHAGHPGSIRFTSDHFDANWRSGCQRHALGDRAPDASQIAALIAQRKQAQATYDDLTTRAAMGDRSVNFTQLRASYPFTVHADVNSISSGPLLEQAEVAAKGKDCPTAMEKLDEVLKIDYTIISAHRLRSSCLKGRPAGVESRIADELMASLRHAGNGKREETAYSVMTVHEERDILADKHIAIKTRDVEVRGSNGHFYDVVHGISLQYGDIRIQDVYFDVTAEVNGRKSAMAADEAGESATQ